MDRISRDEMFFEIAHVLARRSTCTRAQVGAIIVKENRIISTGYCGSPPGWAHCSEVGCLVVDDHCVRTIHAEANAIAWAARLGTSTVGATIYITLQPCYRCSQLILAAGIQRLLYSESYPDESGLKLLEEVIQVDQEYCLG